MEPELIQYAVLDVAKVGRVTSPEQAREITAALGNTAVEMQGETDPASLLLLFFALIGTANEITYRPDTARQNAAVLYSVFLDDEIIRPADVMTPCDWTPSELEALSSGQNKSKTAEIKVDLAKIWQETAPQNSADTENNPAATATHLKAFLEKVYAVSPKQTVITFTSPVSPAALCLAALWFHNSTEEIRYKKTLISRKIAKSA